MKKHFDLISNQNDPQEHILDVVTYQLLLNLHLNVNKSSNITKLGSSITDILMSPYSGL